MGEVIEFRPRTEELTAVGRRHRRQIEAIVDAWLSLNPLAGDPEYIQHIRPDISNLLFEAQTVADLNRMVSLDPDQVFTQENLQAIKLKRQLKRGRQFVRAVQDVHNAQVEITDDLRHELKSILIPPEPLNDLNITLFDDDPYIRADVRMRKRCVNSINSQIEEQLKFGGKILKDFDTEVRRYDEDQDRATNEGMPESQYQRDVTFILQDYQRSYQTFIEDHQ